MGIGLYDYQVDAINHMKNGCILCGGVGTGKSRTALGYYYLQNGGDPNSLTDDEYEPMDDVEIRDLYIITTAHKRDTHEWEGDMAPFLLSTDPKRNLYRNKVIIDSWNNIQKYKNVYGAFFIFDEDRVCGSGAWVKAFYDIARKNKWIILSATPGDTWTDYIPVFIANKFYKNKTEFIREHVIYSRFTKYPKVERYVNTGMLIRYRNEILVDMEYARKTVPHHIDIPVSFDSEAYKGLIKNRWNIWTNKPIKNASELCYCLRKVVNLDDSRQVALLRIVEDHPRIIVFYNFDYELEILKNLYYGPKYKIAEWNGHCHQQIPDSKHWVYLVQYTAGCEGWNCIKTDTIVFYSQNYSYKVLTQASGRIDRLNTPYTDLYYYHLKSKASIDLAISRALSNKKKFNESKFIF